MEYEYPFYHDETLSILSCWLWPIHANAHCLELEIVKTDANEFAMGEVLQMVDYSYLLGRARSNLLWVGKCKIENLRDISGEPLILLKASYNNLNKPIGQWPVSYVEMNLQWFEEDQFGL